MWARIKEAGLRLPEEILDIIAEEDDGYIAISIPIKDLEFCDGLDLTPLLGRKVGIACYDKEGNDKECRFI